MTKRKTPAKSKAKDVKRNKPSLKRAVNKARTHAMDSGFTNPYDYPIQPPELMPGVVPGGVKAPVLAMDINPYEFAAQIFPGGGFPGFPYLAQLATRGEYRAFASTMSTEITREWIEFVSKQDDDDDTADKIKKIEEEFNRLKVRAAVQRAAEHDCYFGRGQLYIDIAGQDKKTPLILSPRTIKKGSLKKVVSVEAVWTTPYSYDSKDPSASDFYKPSKWFMLGEEVHASRLMTIVTRPLPDMLKPAFNFAGMSLSQLAEPYVDNWLRTRQSVADLINNFSITILSTDMGQVLQGDDDGADLLDRADLFTLYRSNKGLMLLDKEREAIVQVNTPLSGLHELQAQSQEHMCSISRMPAIILTGISPSGLNATSEGEIRVFYDWISAQQEAYWRDPIDTIFKAVQLSLFGEIDPDIDFQFVPLYQMTPKELSEIRAADGVTDVAYVGMGILDPSEVRDKLAKSPTSGYQGLDTDLIIVPPNEPPEGETPPDGLEGNVEIGTSALQNKQVSLNGAQISSMVEVSQSVAAGTLAETAAIAILTTAFPLSEEEAKAFLAKPDVITQGEGDTPILNKAQDNDELIALLVDAGGYPEKVNLEQFIKGFNVESEHAETVGGDRVTVAKIVLDHLAEDPEYYTKLAKVNL